MSDLFRFGVRRTGACLAFFLATVFAGCSGPAVVPVSDLTAPRTEAEARVAEKRAEMQRVEARVAALQAQLVVVRGKQQSLDEEQQVLATRLANAEKLTGGLGDELARWVDDVASWDFKMIAPSHFDAKPGTPADLRAAFAPTLATTPSEGAPRPPPRTVASSDASGRRIAHLARALPAPKPLLLDDLEDGPRRDEHHQIHVRRLGSLGVLRLNRPRQLRGSFLSPFLPRRGDRAHVVVHPERDRAGGGACGLRAVLCRALSWAP